MTGEKDQETSRALREVILDALRGDGLQQLLVVLDAVTFLSAAGITALLAGQRQAARVPRTSIRKG